MMRSALEGLPQRTPPANGQKARLHGKRPSTAEVHALLRPAALDAIKEHALSDGGSEVGGVLLGQAFAHQERVYVDVEAALPAVSDDHGPVHFTFNADAWSQIHRDKAAHYPELEIVGWFHTHPGLGVFFSADDVVVQSAAFVMPWHVALVIDPAHAELAVFGWVQGNIEPLQGLFEMLDDDGESKLEWRYVAADVWDETYEARLAQQRASQTMPDTSPAAATPVNPWLGLLLGALGVFLSLGLLAGGIFPLYNQNNALESVVVALSSKNLAEASAAGSALCPDPHLQLYAPIAGSDVTVSDAVPVVGTANHPQATGYQIAVRPAGEGQWWTLDTRRRDVTVGKLLEWDATPYAHGAYQLRLTALGRAQQPLEGVAPCVIDFSLTRSAVTTTGARP